ncbi:hypothetical protein D9M71_684670 [compost metagenome]
MRSLLFLGQSLEGSGFIALLPKFCQEFAKLLYSSIGSAGSRLINIFDELAVFLRRCVKLFAHNCRGILYSLPPIRYRRGNGRCTSDSAAHQVESANGANGSFSHPLDGIDDEFADTNHRRPLFGDIE